MKTNEAPEKIYLTQLMLFATPTIRSSDNEVEYVRKDVLIEKARKYITNHFLVPGMDNEINDFVNYLKEK